MATLTSYRGIQVLTPAPAGDGGLALQNDLKTLVDWSPKSSWAQTADPSTSNDQTQDFYPGSIWLRTNTSPARLFVCQSSATGAAVWQRIQLPEAAVVTKTAAYTLTAQDEIVLADASTAAFTVTLPTAVGINGRQYVIKRINSGANNVTVGTTSSQTIDGATTNILNTQYKAIRVVSNGSNWFVI